MKNTPQRIAVEKIVCAMHHHPSADEVYCKVVAELPTISKATVYRILNTLAEEGRLRKVQMHDGADRFDDRLEPHSHIRCAVCGRVDDVDALFSPDKNWIADAKGYVVTGCLMSFEGVCEKCQNKKEHV